MNATFCTILGCTVLLPALLLAHPNHSATQKGIVTPVPATARLPIRSEVEIRVEGNKRVIVANGIPDHPVGQFPNQDNPHTISPQSYRFSMPLKPAAAFRPRPIGMQLFGVAVNGVVFDPATAETWQNHPASGWRYEAMGGAFSLGLDTNHGHVQPSGAYHYHGIPTALLKRLSGGKATITLLGWAADGFPIYGKWGYREAENAASPVVELRSSYRLKKGKRPTQNGQPGGTYDGVFVEDFEYVAGSGHLDECGGRFGVTPEFPEGSYYYVLTEDFPFIPRYHRGTPDPSFQLAKGPNGPREPRGRRPGDSGRGNRSHPPGHPPHRPPPPR